MAATLIDKVLVLPKVGVVLGTATLAALTGPFRGQGGAPTLGEHVINAAMRRFLSDFTIQQIQWVLPPFVDVYSGWCKKNKVTPDIVDIPNSKAKGFWLGDKSTAKYVMIYIHGGGYAIPGTDQHIDLLHRMIQWSGNNLAVFFVSYTLTPHETYPTQLSECVEGFRYVLDLPGRTPETTLIGGDSAGGALTLAVLSHISHPHPQSNAVKPLTLTTNLKGALVIAPWTSSDNAKYPSWDKFGSNRDIVNTGMAVYWAEAYRGKGVPQDEYIYSALAPPEWWKDIKVDQLLCVAGGEEALIDAITAFAETFKQGAGEGKIKFVVGEREIHDAPLNPIKEAELEKLGDRKQEGAIRNWVMEKLT